MENLPIVFIVLLGVVVIIVSQVNRPKGLAQANEQFTYEMPPETVKAAVDRILTEPINVLREDHFWGPSEIVQSGEGHYTLRYTIYFETKTLPSETGRQDDILNKITLLVNVREKDKNTSVVSLSFSDNAGLVKGPDCSFITSVTRSRLTERLAQLSVQRKGY